MITRRQQKRLGKGWREIVRQQQCRSQTNPVLLRLWRSDGKMSLTDIRFVGEMEGQLEGCEADLVAQKLCMQVLKLNALRDCVREFCGLNENLRQVMGLLKSRPSQLQQTLSKTLEQPPSQAAPSIPVQRNTRPTQGIREDGVIWIKADFGEKALEKDNPRSEAYFALRNRLVAKENEGKKGLAEGGNWFWLSQQGDWIGRKPAKQWSSKR